MKPLIVGEANPYGGDPSYALWPEPEGASGDRLCRLVMGLRRRTYMVAFDRVNLFPTAWRGIREARIRAGELIRQRGSPQVFVLLGTKVRDAFGMRATAPFSRTAVGITAIAVMVGWR